MKELKKVKEKSQNGITLIALVVTIVVLLILAGTSIVMLTGDDGIITNAQNSKISTELSEYKEQLELYISNKKIENAEFEKETLFAGKDTLRYNTQKDGETGTIKTICPEMKSNYVKKIKIKKGKMILETKDKREIKIAVGLGIEVNPYEIKDGELIASEDNLLLIDSNGTLKLPESVTSIGEGAFANTASDGIQLKKVIIPSTVREIKANAFSGNSQIEEVVIEIKNGKGVTTIGDRAFYNCTNLEKIELPDTVTKIGKNLFSYCKALKNVKLSNKLTEIPYEMFRGCYALTKIKISNGVISMGGGAFSGCENLTDITLPNTLNHIEGNVFSGCQKLQNINLQENVNYIFENGILMNKEKTIMNYISSSAINGDTFSVPDGIVELSPNLLAMYITVKKVIIPASVTSIEIGFFPSSIEKIEIDENNSKYISSGGNIFSKDKKTLYMCVSKDIEITVEEGTEEIGWKAFIYSNAITINFPDSLKKIGGYLFNDKIKKINIGKNVNNINTFVFTLATNLTDIQIDEKNPNYTIENGILYNKNKTKLITATYRENFIVADGVTEIAYQAFFDNYTLKNITIPESLTTIGRQAFWGCTNLTKIEIPSSVTTIGVDCFGNIPNLKEIIIHKPKGSISGSPWGSVYGERAIIWDN